MGNDKKEKASKRNLSGVNQNLMERDKKWDVALQRLADEWNAEEDNRS